RPGLIGLAGKQDVAQIVEEGFIHGSISPTNDRERPHLTENFQDLSHAIPLDYHSRYADDVELFEKLEINLLDVFVEQINLMVRHQTSEMRQRARGHCTLLVSGIERQGIVEAPIRGFEFRIDETNLQSLHRESYFLNFDFFKMARPELHARWTMTRLPFCAGIEFAEGVPRKLRINPALFSVVTSYPLGEFSSHASRIGFLRRDVSATSNHPTRP